MTEPLDFSRVPRGQREWPVFVQALSKADDRAERYFLELKSDIDLDSERGRAKVAKFILGAANRAPDQAARRFGGSALLVLGVAKGAVTGIRFIEAKDLERSVRKYLGSPGPGWDFERVRVDDERDVIVIVVDPPASGDPVWTCHSDGPENLKDGGIYIRADGETREAKGHEVRMLLDRAKQSRVSAALHVSVLGVSAFRCDPTVLEDYLATETQRLEAAYLRATRPSEPTELSRMAAMAALTWGGEVRENRTHAEYVREIDTWQAEVRTAWSGLLDHIAAAALPESRVRVQNLSRTFLEEVKLTIHVDGAVWAFDTIHDADLDLTGQLPPPPRAWGPRPNRSLFPQLSDPLVLPKMKPLPLARSPYGVSYKNSESVDLTVQIRHLRPEDTFESDDDEFVLTTRDSSLAELTGSWRATARGHHDVYEGTLTIVAEDEWDFSSGLRKALVRDTSDGTSDAE